MLHSSTRPPSGAPRGRSTGVLVRARRALALASVALVAGLAACTPLGTGPTETSASSSSSSSSSSETSGSERPSDDNTSTKKPEAPTMERNPKPQGVVPEGLEDFYSQEVDWQTCDENKKAQCATIKVPLDYTKPTGETINIAVISLLATGGDPKGNVVYNLGGPGGPAVSTIETSADFLSSDDLRENFNIIGFDPRGVGRSTAVKCFADTAAKDAFIAASPNPADDAQFNQAVATQQKFATDCGAMSNGILGYVDTASAARDLDVLRGILEDKKLDYLGFSYGTILGTTYAKLFPESVGKFVLDGAVQPTADSNALSRGQALGFEAVFKGYIDECLQRGGACPFAAGMTPDAAFAAVDAKLTELETKPLASGDAARPITRSLAASAIFSPLYRHEYWTLALDPVIEALLAGDGKTVLFYSDLFNSRERGEYTDNSTEAFTAINCADERLTDDLPTMRAEAAKLVQAAPHFGKYFGYNAVACAGWPTPVTQQPALTGITGVPPIVIIGSTGDPATPYPWAPALQKSIANSVLVTSQTWGHTAYPSAGKCIVDAVDEFFIDDTVPKDGLVCGGDGPQESAVNMNYEAEQYGNK